LRKDFIVDEFQILEARAHGADAVLLIVAGLADAELSALGGAAKAMGLDVLCEVHDEDELKRALDAGFETVGVNNRNLKTFAVDLETSVRLGGLMPDEVLRVAESGIESAADVAKLRAAGFGAFLVGEQLMRAERPGMELRGLVGAGEKPHSNQKSA
jgi:indole-3-glycerol phosphate synthase